MEDRVKTRCWWDSNSWFSIRELRPGRGRSPTFRGEVQHNNILGVWNLVGCIFWSRRASRNAVYGVVSWRCKIQSLSKNSTSSQKLSPISMATESRVFVITSAGFEPATLIILWTLLVLWDSVVCVRICSTKLQCTHCLWGGGGQESFSLRTDLNIWQCALTVSSPYSRRRFTIGGSQTKASQCSVSWCLTPPAEVTTHPLLYPPLVLLAVQ